MTGLPYNAGDQRTERKACEMTDPCEKPADVDGSAASCCSTADSRTGFTDAEKRCHDALMLSYQEFIDMPREHPDEMRDFVDAVHKIQGLLATRIVRRDYPDYWATYSDQPRQ